MALCRTESINLTSDSINILGMYTVQEMKFSIKVFVSECD